MIARGVALLLAAGLTSCMRGEGANPAARGELRPPAALPASFGAGRAATDSEIAAWDIDVNPAGAGLPAGSGTAIEGAAIYAAKCASCHGAKGEGVPPNPMLVGREPRQGFPFGRDPKLVKTIGNYWPYATTLFDYLRRAMPQGSPGTLTADENYALVAWLLAENEVIPRDRELNATTLPLVRMPARDRFVKDDRTGGAVFR